MSPAGLVLTAVLGGRLLPPYRASLAAARPPTRSGRRSGPGVLSLVLLDAVLGAVYAGALYSAAILVTALDGGMAGAAVRRHLMM